MKTSFTTEELSKYFSDEYFHAAYDDTVKKAREIRVHADGDFPEKLIAERRPSESQAVLDYRQKIWEPITMPVFDRILTALNKIRRSSDWSIRFDETKAPNKIKEGERLSDYLTTKFPFFTSITNWAFSVLLREYCIDANALVACYPIDFKVPRNEFSKPFPFIFRSEQVIEYKENDLAVLKSAEKIRFKQNDQFYEGDSYLILTTTDVYRYNQSSTERDFTLAAKYTHNLGALPVVKTKGLYDRAIEGTFIYRSRLSGIVPGLNEAAREHSDLQAEVVQHIHSEKWEIVTTECTTCKGKQVVPGSGFLKGDHKCPDCNGTGVQPRGPYSTITIKQAMAGEAQAPVPPAGYIEKDVQIVKVQDERIDKHIFRALSSINMEYLARVPLSESGLSKGYDRDETLTFAHSIAEDVVAIIDSVSYFCNEYRYKDVVPNYLERIAMLPAISVPEKFDILSAGILENELKSAKDNGANPVIINAMEIEYANKRFNSDPEIRDRVTLSLKLDPLAGVSDEDKMVRYSNKWITEETAIISSNVQSFINRAIDEIGERFFTLKLKEQKDLMKKYAQEIIDSKPEKVSILPNEDEDDIEDPKEDESV